MKSSNENSNNITQTSDETKHTKKCIKCGETKSLSGFHKNNKAKDGRRPECTTCRSILQKVYMSSIDPIEYKIDKMYRDAKYRAKKKRLDFTIEKTDIQIPERCPCLGTSLKISGYISEGRTGAKPNSPSLDRIDSSKGYTPDNIWVVSHRANAIMNNATSMELKLIASALDDKLYSIEKEKQLELDL